MNKPTAEIIDYARRFHAAGGTRGISSIDDDIPILNESELWDWLVIHTNCISTRYGKIDDYEGNVLVVQNINYNWSPKFPIDNNSLHHALYSAAVWVAE
uniref:Uncharacterized protein n=1 Tax=viral metagenome TaxID=1070528 RepID=A0A6H1ZH01_9ZZZZ